MIERFFLKLREMDPDWTPREEVLYIGAALFVAALIAMTGR